MWNILGIEATGDIKAIKRAYATQLKRTKPEENSEAFQLLRLAYEQAVASAENSWMQYDLEDDSQLREESGKGTLRLGEYASSIVVDGSREELEKNTQHKPDEISFQSALWIEANEQARQLIAELNVVDDTQLAQNLIKQRLQNDWFIYVDAQLFFERCLVEQVALDLELIPTIALHQVVNYFNWQHPQHPLWQEVPYKLEGILIALRYHHERLKMQTPKDYGLLAGFVRGVQKKPNYLKFHYLASTIERKAAVKEQMLIWLDECPEILETDCNAESVKWWQEVIFEERPLLLGNTWFGAIRFALCTLSAIWVFSKLESIQPINPLLFFPILFVHWIALYQLRKFIYEKTQWHSWVKQRKAQFAEMLMQVDDWRIAITFSDKGQYVLSALMLSQMLLMAIFIDNVVIFAISSYILLSFWWGWSEFRRNAFLALAYPALTQFQFSPAVLSNGFFLHLIGCWVVFTLSRTAPTKFLAQLNNGFFVVFMLVLPLFILMVFKA